MRYQNIFLLFFDTTLPQNVMGHQKQTLHNSTSVSMSTSSIIYLQTLNKHKERHA